MNSLVTFVRSYDSLKDQILWILRALIDVRNEEGRRDYSKEEYLGNDCAELNRWHPRASIERKAVSPRDFTRFGVQREVRLAVMGESVRMYIRTSDKLLH